MPLLNTVCPLCHTHDATLIEQIKVLDLVHLYQKSYSFDVRYLFDKPHVDLVQCNSCTLLYYNPKIEGDEEFYNMLQKYPWYYIEDKEEYHYAAKWIAAGSSVLEIGSGKGAFAKRIEQCSYTGLEFSVEAKRMAAEAGIEIKNESVQAHALTSPNIYDVVLSFQVLEHVADIHSFLKASLECLKPGGYMLISVPGEDSFLRNTPNDTLNLPPHHISRWPDSVFLQIAEKFGCSLLEIKHQPSEPQHYFQFMFSTYYAALSRLIGKPVKKVNAGFIYHLLKVPAYFLAKLGQRGLDVNTTPHGHTVTAVFRK